MEYGTRLKIASDDQETLAKRLASLGTSGVQLNAPLKSLNTIVW